MTRLIMSVEGPRTGMCDTELNRYVLAGVAPERRLALPRAMLFVGVMALTVGITPCRRALALVGIVDIHLHTTTNKGTEGRVLWTDAVVAVDGAKVIPKVVLAGNEVVLHLNDPGRRDLVVWQIAKLYRDAAFGQLTVGHVLVGNGVSRNGDSLIVFAFQTRARWADSPGINVVGTVIDEFDFVLC